MTTPVGFVWITGELVVAGYAPDGDSVRFVPTDLATVRRLAGADRLEPDPDDGSLQLRLDAVDAPELHFQGESQPLAEPARDQLLALVGFSAVTYDEGTEGTVASAEPARVPAAIAASTVEANGRPVAVLFAGAGPGDRADGEAVELLDDEVSRSVNAELARTGAAYLTVYNTTPPSVRALFTELCRTARGRRAGVWADDRSAGFTVTDQGSVGPQGQLVLPKVFRRVTTWLASDTTQDLPRWLAEGGDEDDAVQVGDRETTLAALITQDGDTIALTVDVLDLLFLE